MCLVPQMILTSANGTVQIPVSAVPLHSVIKFNDAVMMLTLSVYDLQSIKVFRPFKNFHVSTQIFHIFTLPNMYACVCM